MKPMLKFQKKLFFAYSAILIPILVVFTAFILYSIYSAHYKSVQESQQELVIKIQQQIDTSIKEMDRIISSMIFNKQFRAIIESREKQIENYTSYNKAMGDIFVTLDAPLFETHRLIVFNKYAYYTFVKSNENREQITYAKENYPWAKQLEPLLGGKIVIEPHYDIFSVDKVPVISVARNVINNSGEILSTIEIQLGYDKLETICEIDSSIGKIVIFSQDGDAIYPFAESGKMPHYLYPGLYGKMLDTNTESGRVLYENSNIFFSKSTYCQWTVALMPARDIAPFFSMQVLAVTVAIFVLLCAIMLFIIRMTTTKIIKPLAELNNSIREVSIDNLSLKLSDSHEFDEISFINKSFKKMFSQLQDSIAKSIQLKANEERANYLALEAQMNPHTIYNTIAMIEAVSYMNGDREVSELCINFSQMLRYISDYTAKDYKIRDELQHLKNYARLTEKRYDGDLVIKAECEDCLLDTLIPKFTLQPLVENSIKHGISGAGTGFKVDVDIFRIEDGFCILVTDNGVGFDIDKLKEVYSQFALYDENMKTSDDIINMKIGHLALINIYVRFKLMYGDRFEIKIYNNSDKQGCTIEIIVYNLKE